MKNSRTSYKLSFPVLTGITVLMYLLFYADLSPIGYSLCFGLISILLEAGYVLHLHKEEVEHGA